MTDTSADITALRASLAEARELNRLNDVVDDLLERAVRDRKPLERAIEPLMPVLAEATGAVAVWVRTWDERLELHDFHHHAPDAALTFRALSDPLERIHDRIQSAGRYVRLTEDFTVIGQTLVVADEVVGTAAVLLTGRHEDADVHGKLAKRLDVWCEELDNYLAAMALSRHKHRVVAAIADALRDPVLDLGLAEAVRILHAEIKFTHMIVVFRHEDDEVGEDIHYTVARDGEIVHSSANPIDDIVDELMHAEAVRLILGQPTIVLERLGIQSGREEALISGVRNRQVIGRVVVTSRYGEFSTFDRDLLERFSEYIRLRIVDFNRVWKQLTRHFGPPAVKRLVAFEDYRTRFLSPREDHASILFADIAGFTRLCESIGSPATIGALVDRWADRVVDAIFASGGVFDKMVGDCVIAFWGPPFGDRSPAERAAACLETALRISHITRKLSDDPDFADVLEDPLDVAVGLADCAVMLGTFGPGEDYTAFGPGMNNTARLQGLAAGGEVLASEAFCEALGQPVRFGEVESAAVKNVAEPLRFRRLKRDD